MENEDGSMNKDWGKCFMAETTIVRVVTSIIFEDDWIADSNAINISRAMLLSFFFS